MDGYERDMAGGKIREKMNGNELIGSLETLSKCVAGCGNSTIG